MSEKLNWNNAPEWATHILEHGPCWSGGRNSKNEAFALYKDGEYWSSANTNGSCYLMGYDSWMVKSERAKLNNFDKEFCVRGGKNIEEVWQPCEILFEGDKYIVVRNKSGKEFSRRKAKIKLRNIDMRSAEEKALDDIANCRNVPKERHSNANIIESIKNGEIYGVKWVGDEAN